MTPSSDNLLTELTLVAFNCCIILILRIIVVTDECFHLDFQSDFTIS